MISSLRHASLTMHLIAQIVNIAFTMLIFTPAVMAAKAPELPVKQTQAVVEKASSAEAKFSQTLQQLESVVTDLQQTANRSRSALNRRSEDPGAPQAAFASLPAMALVKPLREQLETLDKQVMQNFNTIQADLEQRQLPAVILERHQQMVKRYQTELASLLKELFAVEAADNPADQLRSIKAVSAFLKSKQNKRSHQPFDPNQLPNSSLKPDPNNKPKETEKDFIQAGLYNTPYPTIAALGDFTFDKLAGADNPAYLAASIEVTLSQAIKDKAAALNNDPVKIYHWVRNNVEWLPSWGGIQDADLTLSSQRGNAMDVASLTIALLRAANIPARYVHGTIDVPADAFNNWVGNFANINAAADYAASGGIPVTTVTTGGTISKIRMEHIWVEAAIDYHPSKGAINKDADSWVEMDPSYKQYEYLTGLDTLAISGIDPQALAQSFIDSGTVNETEGWVTGFNPAILETAQTQAQQKLETYIQNNLTDPTVGDVIGGRKTIIKEYPVLPSSLPNPIKVTGTRYDKLPAALQQTITYGFIKGILGDISDPLSFPWAQLNNKKVTLSFKPATQADEDALASLLPEGEITDISQLPTSIPSYLVRVVPELKVEGQVVKTGGAMKLGEDLDFTTGIKFAGRGQLQSPRTYKVIAGSYLSVNVFAGSVSPQKLLDLKTRLEQTKTKLESADQTQIAALTREDLLGDLFQSGSLGYYAQYLALSHLLGLQADGHYQLAAGTGTVGYEPNVDYFFGFPRSIKPGSVAFDIPLINIMAVDDGDAEKKKQFVIQTGILSSALEHAVPEQMFNTDPTNPPDAISAVKALAKANAAGQRIYQITQANSASILGNIHHDQSTMDEIRAALAVGKEVITHTDAVSVPGWSGAGYIILDPVTGDGAYKIGGGANGGFLLAAGGAILIFLAMFLIPVVGGLLPFIILSAGIHAYLIGVIENIRYFNVDSLINAVGFVAAVVFFASLTPFVTVTAAANTFILGILASITTITGAARHFLSLTEYIPYWIERTNKYA